MIEDIPGVGKTTLAQALARSTGLNFQRIQCTSDLLPADIVGNSIYDSSKGGFIFHPGPLFAQTVLVDEVNRATPKTQSALLEAMEEGQVSVDGITHPLPQPFFVVATQNPRDQAGTFPLPESQLDRFMMRISVGYPDRASERDILLGGSRRKMLSAVTAVMGMAGLHELQEEVEKVHVSNLMMDYVQDLIAVSREGEGHGLSPRAGLAFLAAAKAWALLDARESVWPEDFQRLAEAVMAHRLGGDAGAERVQQIVRAVEVPL